MSLTRLTVENKHTVWALAIAAAIFGTLAYFSLPMQLFPDTSPPVVTVVTAWPGASAEDVAESLSRPLEEEFSSMEGVVEISSSSQDNMSLVTVEFQYTRDPDIAAVDTQNAVARIRQVLPDNIQEPQVLKIDSSDRPVITVGVAGDDLVDVRRRAEDVFAPLLQRVDGVAAVDVFGGAEDAVIVDIDRRELEAYGVPFFRVVEAIQTHDTAMPAGSLRTGRTHTSFRVEARAGDLHELGELSLATPGGSRLRLADLARIERGSLDDDARYAVDGERAIAVQVYKTSEANTVDVVGQVQAYLDELGADYPGLDFRVGEEEASFTEQSISNLLSNVWQAVLLASIIIFLFIGRVRPSLVAVVSMPLSYGITFALMKATGTDFDMVTLTAVILAVGMVVDASVVVLENIMRRREQDGLSAAEAAIEGTDEIRLAVLAGAASTVVVLIPLLLLGGFVGATFGPLARTLLFAFVSSVLVALVLVPVLTIYTGGHSRIDELGAKLVVPFRWSMDKLRDVYLALLRGSLRARFVPIVLALAALAGGVYLIGQQGMDVLPKMDGGSFFVSLETPSGSSLQETEYAVRDVEAILAGEPEVVKTQSQIGFEQGMKTFSTTGAQGPTQGFITVTLTPRTERDESIWQIEQRVRDEIRQVPGIRTATVRELGNTAKSTTAAPIAVQISGADPLVLDRLGEEVVARMADVAHVVEPVRTWRIDQKRIEVDVDAARAGQIGASPTSVARQMLAGSDGIDAGQYDGDSGSTPPIRVRFDRAQMLQPDDLLDFPVFTPDSAEPIPLRSVASLRETTGQALVTRKNFAPTLEVTAFTDGRALSFVAADVEQALADLEAPRGYEIELAGERDDLGEARSALGGALGISLIAVYLLLVAQLRSFLHPITIMGSVPLSLSGVGVALWLADKPMSMPVMVGLILLVGMVVNNAILLIDFIRQARQAGQGRREAIVASVQARFRPIMMTALSTIVGMIPLAGEWALGAERFSPLAVAVIGGLTAATFLTLIVIPVIYDLFEDLGDFARRVGGWVSGRSVARSSIAVVLVASVSLFSAVDARAAEPVEISVEQARQMARQTSSLIGARDAEVRAAEARQAEARSRFFPRVALEARASKLSEVEPGQLELPSAQPGAEAPAVQFGEAIDHTYVLRATVTQPLFTGWAITRGHRSAKEAVALSELRRDEEASDVDLQVEEAYFGLFRARRMLRVAEGSVELLEGHLARVERLREAERATRLDVARVESRLAEARLAYEQARGGVAVAEQSLETLLGLEAGAEIVLVDPVLEQDSDFEPTLADEAELTAAAMQQRPELRVARQAGEVQKARADAARSALWPTLYLQAGYTLANPHERYFPPESEFNDSWDVSLILQWELWDWGGNRRRVEAADHEAAAANQRALHLEDFTGLAVRQGMVAVRTARRRIAAARQSVAAAQRAYDTAEQTFAAGRLDSTELLDTEVELSRARANLAAARADAGIARAQLRRIVGGSIP